VLVAVVLAVGESIRGSLFEGMHKLEMGKIDVWRSGVKRLAETGNVSGRHCIAEEKRAETSHPYLK
jgi:hypothetical protein